MDFAAQVGFRIKSCRLSARLTQAQLSDRSGITQSHLSQIENGKFPMTIETFGAICRGLKMQPDILLKDLKI